MTCKKEKMTASNRQWDAKPFPSLKTKKETKPEEKQPKIINKDN